MVNSIFSDVIENYISVYLYDLVIVYKNLDSHPHKLDLVFNRFKEAGLKAILTKSDFMRSRIQFLVVDGNGILTVDSEINEIKHSLS